ncbi:unnamed protein product [Menidia menidia]|uniref:(Atlantic silverside) hypothetical protein n=1 Tax=Menidia menidia TaxID=238744 RepID=A0A8S4A578_9TELE|nr:unnamed protein product [Menidia menidia]
MAAGVLSAPLPADGRSLLLAPCLADAPAAQLLESRVREVEEENRQMRLQLSQSQGAANQPADGNYGNQQWGASADTLPEDGDNTAEEKSNHTDCPRPPTVHKCEVGHFLFVHSSANQRAR